MSATRPAIFDHAAFRSRTAPMLTVLFALLLTGCGSDSTEEELMRRVVAAEAAAATADTARVQAEQALANLDSADIADDAELSENPEDPGGQEEVADFAPNEQDPGSEAVAPPAPAPAPAPAPQEGMPA